MLSAMIDFPFARAEKTGLGVCPARFDIRVER